MLIQAPDTAKEAVKDIPRDQYWRGEARDLLLRRIRKEALLMQDAEKIRDAFPQFSCAPWVDILCPKPRHPIGWWDDCGHFQIGAGIDESMSEVRYSREIESYVQRLGLRCVWGPEGVHYLVSWSGAYPGDYWVSQARIAQISMAVLFTPGLRWSAVKAQIVREAKRQFDAIAEPLRERAGLPDRDRGPENLERDVELLFVRVCLGLGPLEIWNKWERSHDLSDFLTVESVRQIISDTACLLGIPLRDCET